MPYLTYPAIDEDGNFPPALRAIIAQYPEFETKFAHLNAEDQLVIDGIVIETGGGTAEPPTPAGLNTFGFVQGIFIENEGTLPPDLPIYSIVIEQE